MAPEKSTTPDLYGAATPWIDLSLRAWDITLASAQAGPQAWQQWVDGVNTFMVVASRPSAAASSKPVARAHPSKRRTR
jgi:hypothetical protein